jgi:hypothetical protein
MSVALSGSAHLTGVAGGLEQVVSAHHLAGVYNKLSL